MSETREIPSRGSRMSALRSALQFAKFYGNIFNWPEAQAAKLGAPVFCTNLMMPSVVVIDAVAAAHIFAAPKGVCDRLGNFGFGPLVLRPRIVGKNQPALTARDAENARDRRFIDAAFKDALPRFEEVMVATVDDLANNWASRGTVPLAEVHGIGTKITGQWLLDIDLDTAKTAKWLKMSIAPNTGSRILNWLADIFTGPGKSGEKIADSLFEQFRTAPRADHLRGIAKETGLSDEDALRQIAFLTMFNTAGLSSLMTRTLAQLALTPDWAAAIRDEIGDTQLTLKGMNDFPVLRKVYLESSRLFSGPRVFYREAMSAFDLPCGDGNTYRVEKGDTLLLLKRSIQSDKRKFTDPHVFNPDRFDNDSDLLNYIFIFGPHDKPYQCAAYNLGFAAGMYMYILGRLLQGWDWKVTPEFTISSNTGNFYTPEDLTLAQFRARA